MGVVSRPKERPLDGLARPPYRCLKITPFQEDVESSTEVVCGLVRNVPDSLLGLASSPRTMNENYVVTLSAHVGCLLRSSPPEPSSSAKNNSTLRFCTLRGPQVRNWPRAAVEGCQLFRRYQEVSRRPANSPKSTFVTPSRPLVEANPFWGIVDHGAFCQHRRRRQKRRGRIPCRRTA
jgi:hypothetical protein